MDERNTLTRRSFLGIAGALPFAWTVGRALPAWAVARIPVALQLYSVRGDCKQNFDAALEQVAAMGFEGVEFAGYYNYAGQRGRAGREAQGAEPEGRRHARPHGRAAGRRAEEHDRLPPGHRVPLPRRAGRRRRSPIREEQGAGRRDERGGRHAQAARHGHRVTTTTSTSSRRTATRRSGISSPSGRRRTSSCSRTAGGRWPPDYDPAAYIRKCPGRTRDDALQADRPARATPARRRSSARTRSTGSRSTRRALTVGGTEWIVLEQEVYPDGKSPMDCTRESLPG
ncbi:MAG: hypothetical protein MZW92_40335 [Comamonadaceae bacterium]|nr:hypothetical protein [Comamonadaceae bacterium]